jgi:glycosyltransferase involved in cell wall biosynthesis
MLRPKISAVIPTYNRKDYVREAINSVLNQSTPPFEVIVVDDGSTDGTVDALDDFKGRIRLHQQSNQGAGAARNAGIQLAEGEWIAFLDSDDTWGPNYLECQIANILAHPQIHIHHADLTFEDLDGSQTSRFAKKGFLTAFGSKFNNGDCLVVERPLSIILNYGLCHFQSTVARKEKLVEVGLFPTDLPMSEDWVLMGYLSRWPVNYCRRTLATVFRRPEAMEHLSHLWNQDTLKKYETLHQVFSRIRSMPALSWSEKRTLDSMLSSNCRARGNLLLRSGQAEGARSAFREAWRFSPSLTSGLKYVASLLPTYMALQLQRKSR